MIIYFADRRMNILGVASDVLPGAFHTRDDMKTQEVETGVMTFEVAVDYKKDTHLKAKEYCKAGNFLLVKAKDGTYTPFTIIDKEDDIIDRHIYIYAEDAGLDLLNEIVPAYESVTAQTASSYILTFTSDSGFEIGTDELGTSLTRTLSWDGESTATERIRSVATEFDNAELSYSFTIDKFKITHKYINIYKKHGKDIALELRVGREINSLTEKESVANLVTALRCVGGTPESTDANPEPVPITFVNENTNPPTIFSRDDGDIYTDGVYLKSRAYNQKWTRYLTETGTGEGYIVGSFDYDTTSQEELYNRAVTELKKRREPEMTYEVGLNYLPENLKIGDTCRIVDDNGELYLSARLIELKISECNGTREATFGDFVAKTSGINEKVQKLADEFAKIQAAKTLYTWIVFADDNQGTNMSTSSEGKDYIGIATNKISATPDLNDPSYYTFSRINAIDGTDGRGFTVRGAWASGVSYSITSTNIDVVEYEGSTYACNNSHVSGQTFDPSKWVLIAEKGTGGEDGERGLGILRITTAPTSKTGTTSTGFSYKYRIPTQTVITESGMTKVLVGDTLEYDEWHYPVGAVGEYVYLGDRISLKGPQGISGQDGDDGYSQATIYVYKRSSTTVSTNPGAASYAFSTGVLTFDSTSDWTREIPSTNGDPCYVSSVSISSRDSSTPISIAQGDWSTPTKLVEDGKSITQVINWYLASASASGVTTSTSGWTTDPTSSDATISDLKPYLWNYEVTKNSAGTTISTTTPNVIGHFGMDGQGSDGKGIVSITEYYQKSNSGSTAPSNPSSWPTTPPETSTSEPYLWNYEVITYTTGSPTTTTPRVIGVHGQDGYSPVATVTKEGDTATITITDKNGTTTETVSDGESVTVSEVKYATSSTEAQPNDSAFTYSSVPTVSAGNWLWTRITYSDNNKVYSKSYQGLNGNPGSPGQSSYTYVRYSANSDGSNMNASPDSTRKYIGVYVGTSSTAPTTPSSYTWSKYLGEDGNGILSKTDYYMLADTMDSSELSTAKAHFPHDIGPVATANFSNAPGGIKFKKLLVNIEPTITGSGDPTPSNLHTITGKTSSDLYVSATNSSESALVSLSWSDTAGTIYKGTWDVVNGTLINNYRLLDMGSLTGWSYYTGSGGTILQNVFRWHTTSSSNIKKHGITNVLSTGYKTTSSDLSSMEDYSIRGSSSSEYVYVKNPNYTDKDAFTAAMSGVYMLYEYENPPVYEVTPEDIFQLTGTNYVWSDSGNNVTLTYYDEVTPTWGTDPLEPNAYSKYLWWKYGTIYTEAPSTEVMSDPAIIGVYNQDWYEDTQKALNNAEKAQNKADEGYDKAVAASSAASENSGRLDSVERKTETLERNVNSAQTDISSLLTIIGSSDSEGLRKFQKEASDTLDYLQKTLGDFTAWMEFKSRQDNPDDKTGLIIGKIANTGEYVVQIEGDAISFYENLDAARTSDSTKRVAFFQNHYLYVDNAKIGGNMEIDSFRFIPQANGNLSFVYIGGIE